MACSLSVFTVRQRFTHIEAAGTWSFDTCSVTALSCCHDSLVTRGSGQPNALVLRSQTINKIRWLQNWHQSCSVIRAVRESELSQ